MKKRERLKDLATERQPRNEGQRCRVVVKGMSFHNLLFRPRPGIALTAVQLSAVEFVAENVSRRIPLAINPLKPPEKDASAPVGKMAMAQISARA